MGRHDVRRLVFSSSCTVYGEPAQVPITEDFPRRGVNPYGRTKLICEDILFDLAAAEPGWRISLLRYFNPVGAHASGELGEDPRGVPNNLMPYLMQVAVGRRDRLAVYGGDYPTRDGTCIRDYLHVVDLAQGHLAALDALEGGGDGCRAFNLGTGTGTTVLEMIEAASAAVGRPLPYEIVDPPARRRRRGLRRPVPGPVRAGLEGGPLGRRDVPRPLALAVHPPLRLRRPEPDSDSGEASGTGPRRGGGRSRSWTEPSPSQAGSTPRTTAAGMPGGLAHDQLGGGGQLVDDAHLGDLQLRPWASSVPRRSTTAGCRRSRWRRR